MARFDRCSVCDYTREHGSQFAGVGPRAHGKVRLRHGRLLCDRCEGAVVDVMEQFAIDDYEKELEKNGAVQGSTPTMPVRE